MKKNFKLLLTITVTLTALSFSQKTLAATTYIEGTRCPEAPNRALSSICGIVKSAMSQTKTLSDGTTVNAGQQGIEGVTVSIYECDNSSPTCKKNGNLVHPFSSTWTNEEGRFYVTTRKLDSEVELNAGANTVKAVIPSKRRYLVFTCGKIFAGLQIIPSYVNLTEIFQEVSCARSVYNPPINRLKFVDDTYRLSNQMGTDEIGAELDANGKKPGEVGYINHMTVQTYFDVNNPTAVSNVKLQLEGADPRFTVPKAGEGTLLTDYKTTFPEIGAYWSLDCLKKYENTPFQKFCMGFKGGQSSASKMTVEEALSKHGLEQSGDNIYRIGGNQIIMTADDFKKGLESTGGTTLPREAQIAVYEEKLYYDPDFVIQNKLPNISPKAHILFYKEFTARQDLVEYVQDPTDIAHYIHAQFSNCVGSVFLRNDGQERHDKYATCDIFKKCNEVINNIDNRNSSTTSGPSKLLASPLDFQYMEAQVDPETVICTLPTANTEYGQGIDAQGSVIRIKDIQPPWDLNASKYRLDSSYWSPEFLFFFGRNNVTAKLGYKFENIEDSYSTSDPACNREPFKAYDEANGNPVAGCVSPTITSGGKRPNNTLAGALAMTTSGNDFSMGLPLTSFMSTPNKNRAYYANVLGGIGIYTLTGKPRVLGEYSNVNFPSEKLITNPEQDVAVLNNADFKGNEDHWPFQDLIANASPFNIIDTVARAGVVASAVPTVTQARDYGTHLGYAVAKDNSSLYGPYGIHLTMDDFIKDNSSQIIDYDYQSKTQGYELEMRDGTRTPTSAIYMTSAAYARHLALKDTTYKGNKGWDFFDSLLTTLYGDGKVDFGIATAISNGFKELLKAIPVYDINTPIEIWRIGKLIMDNKNKSFFDRRNADTNLGDPGFIEDLKTWGYLISEENFIEEFPLPIAPGRVNGTHLLPKDWGGQTDRAKTCYPWNQMGLNGKCETSDIESIDKISRTCRVDKCTRTTTRVTCTCRRNTERTIYTVSCPTDVRTAEVSISDVACEDTNPKSEDDARRLICAQRQKTCLTPPDTTSLMELPLLLRNARNLPDERECIQDTYAGDIRAKWEVMVRNESRNFCGPNNFTYEMNKFGINSLDIHQPVNARIEGGALGGGVGTPSCLVSRAGPNTCDGTLIRDSAIRTNQQIVRLEDDAINVDPMAAADNELRQSFRSPLEPRLTYFPAAFVTVNSSIRDLEARDISKRKDTFGPGGSGSNGAVPRSMFNAPITSELLPQYNPLMYHCINSTLGSSGFWICEFTPPPNPEIIDINAIKVKPACKLNPSPKCIELILGEGNEFSDTFIKIISGAASRFNIPASMILAYLNGIGNATGYGYYWSTYGEQDLYDVSAPWYGTFGKCDDLATSAEGPFDWLLSYFNLALTQVGGGAALDELASGRSKTASRCNFLDAVYVAAANLSNKDGGSCSAWTWNDLTKGRLYTMTYGSNRVGAYASSTLYGDTSRSREIFEACK